MITRFALFMATAAFLLAPAAPAAPGNSEKTEKLIAVLQSDAPLFEKARACQQLGEIGTGKAVPALAALLNDEHLSAYARSGLEGIPDPDAAAALRAALGTLKGQRLTGVINSLGVLRDAKAVAALRKLAADPGSGVVKEAMLALGRVSTEESIQIIRHALTDGPEAFRPDAAAACLVAAEKQQSDGNERKAVFLYDAVRKANLPAVYRSGATRGAILARKSARVAFLIEQLRSEDRVIRSAALLTIREIPDDKLATALNRELAKAKPDLELQLLTALVDCHNPQSLKAIQTEIASHDPEIRKAALTALGKIGGPTAAEILLKALADNRSPDESSIALSSLRQMEGSAIDVLLLKTLSSSTDGGMRIHLIRLVDSRGVTNATAELLKQAAGSDVKVSLAAFHALKPLAGPNELPTLIALTKTCKDQCVREAAENAVASACTKTDIGNSGAEAVLAELKQATKPADRNSWINILTTVGYPPALPAIKAAVGDANETIVENALTHLGRWPDPTPIDILFSVVDTGTNPRLRSRALASAIDLATTAADEGQRPDAIVVGWLQRANRAAQSIDEKRRIISVLGRLKTVESFRLLVPYLDDGNLQVEAALAVVQIAPALAKTEDSPAVKAALEKAATTVHNPDIRNRAAEVAKTIPDRNAPASLFDGRSLDGWEGDTNVWRVQEGVIVGGSMIGNPRNEFLATVTRYTNFVLRLEYKLVGTEGFINSGVQFRSVRVKQPPNEMSGYQADIGAGHSGCLYDESRRNNSLARATDEQIKRLEKPGDWNHYEVRCAGPHIQIVLNGEKTVDYTEADASIPQDGQIALQIHGGSKAEASFRNITIEESPHS